MKSRNVRYEQKGFRIWKKAVLFAVCLAGIWCGSIRGMAAETVQDKPLISENEGDQAYVLWSYPKNSELEVLSDGTLERTEGAEDGIHIEHYSADAVFQDARIVERELPLYGGSYCGTKYHFLVFGQSNHEQSDAAEVIRIVRYDADWNRVDQVSLYGANTYEPFEAGCVRMVQEQDMLYLRTSHKMYDDGDGRHHQANLTLAVHVTDDKMEIKYKNTGISNNKTGYVSHSFNQFITSDGTNIIAADHGDANPRAMVLFRYAGAAGNASMDNISNVCVLPIAGKIGANRTNASLGGLQVSDSAYLVAGNSAEQTEEGSTSTVGRPLNIFLTVTKKDDFSENGTTFQWVTDFKQGECGASTPHLVKISGDRFVLMWMRGDGKLNYQFFDGEGNKTGTLYEQENVSLSDCDPVYKDGKIFWYATAKSRPAFYSLDAEDGSLQILDQPMISDPDVTVSVEEGTYQYRNTPITPHVTVTAGTDRTPEEAVRLKENENYTVTYQDNINAGTAAIIVRGTGIYSGEVTAHFTISPVSQDTVSYDNFSGTYFRCDQFVTPRMEERFLHIGETTKLTAAGVGTVTYTSLNPSVATVDADGIVTAAGWGDCRIQVDMSGGGNWFPYKGNVIVYVYQNDDNRGNDSSTGGSGNSTGTGGGSQDSYNNGLSEDSGAWDDDEDESEENPWYTGLSTGSRFTVSGVNYKVTAERQVQYVKSVKSKKGSVRIPDTVYYRSNVYTVTSIAAKAFRKNTKITAVTIGKNITSIGKQAFYGCKKLKRITVLTTALTEKNTGSAAFKGVSKKASVRLPQKLTAKQKKNYRKWLKKQGFA